MPSLVRLQNTFYGSNRIGSCITSDWIPPKLLGTVSENSNIHHARRWTVAIWLSSLFSNYGKSNKFTGDLSTRKTNLDDCGRFIAFSRWYKFKQAAARHQCTYLVNLHEKEFLEQRGDPNWLKGLDHIPPKLRAIYDINKILAHRPWLLNKEHIEVIQEFLFPIRDPIQPMKVILISSFSVFRFYL